MGALPRGGARARSGPAPDPNALRRDRLDDQAEWTELPAAGREGPTPEWPLEVEADEWERRHWEELWRTPQAVMWERNRDHVAVAVYVRTVREAGRHDAPAAVRTSMMRMRDALGLTVLGMRANRWRIGTGDRLAAATGGRRRSGRSVRDRFTVVDGGGAGS